LAPASDVDLFIYGLNEEQAIDKIKQIEADVRDAILSETTVVRTKNAITIVSEYPTRHIQIVLRLYKSVSEILTGFDVDCACVAYDGKQVWAAPRALAAFATQTNSIDLTRRSPSYENRLSKYARRGFEVYWPQLDRSRVDPTIYERAFNRVLGLARLLVLEKLPHPQDRDEYLAKRRAERGRPEMPWNARFRHQLPGNVKDTQPDDVAEWVEEDDISSYHTFTLPYGPRYTPKKIERLLFKQDLLKNAEWNKPKDRETNLHRHPAFFGRVEDVIGDCCGYCPRPVTDEDLAAWEEESKVFVSGNISFLKDDPGRQAIGSFRPLTDGDWTEMAYLGNTTRLCQAIVDKDLEGVVDWFSGEEANVDRRDHTGRTPLQLAVVCSTPEIVQCLIDRGARIVARLYNGCTALHLAAWRGSPEMVKALLDKSAENEAEADAKEEQRKQARRKEAGRTKIVNEDVEMTQEDEIHGDDDDDSDAEDLMDEDSDVASEDRMTGSFVKIEDTKERDANEENVDDPDVYDIDVVAWDSPCSALHLALIAGHQDVIRLLIDTYGADAMLPVKLMTNHTPRVPRAAILTLLLPLDLPLQKATETVKTLLGRGASPVQADMNQFTSLHYIVDQAKTEILKAFREASPEATTKAINHTIVSATWQEASVETPLLAAIRSGSPEIVKEVLSMGAKPVIELEDFVKAYKASKNARDRDPDELRALYLKSINQPITQASRHECMIEIVPQLLKRGADVNTLTADSWSIIQDPDGYHYNQEGKSLLDLIRDRRIKLEDYANEKTKEDKTSLKQPEPLKSDEHYLSGLKPGSYQHFSAVKDLERAKYVQAGRAMKFQHDFDAQKEVVTEPGHKEKKEAAAELARKFKAVENRLFEEGALTFYEMYPKLKKEENQGHSTSDRKENLYDYDELAYKTTFKFHGTDITPAKQPRYIQLFEAAFAGDIEKVKALCLSSDDSARALQITVFDDNGFDPFNIAVLKGHHELAGIVLDIAAAQYENNKETKRMQYSLQPYGSDDERDSDTASSVVDDDEQPKFYVHLVDDNFTVDDVAALSKDVKSNVRPQHLLQRIFELWRVMDMGRDQALQQCRVDRSFNPDAYVGWRDKKKPWIQFDQCARDESYRTRFSLWTYAVVSNNVQLLKFLLESEVKYSMEEPNELLKSLDNRRSEMRHAMNLGHREIVDTLISYRGTLLPLHHLAERSGIVVEEAPKYYQGLSVYGQKRKDWARQDRYADTIDKSETGSPLLDALLEGNLDMVDYFLSDTPARRYEEFCSRFSKDQRIRALAEDKGGVPAALRSWMSTRTNLALHVAVMSWPAGANSRLRYLLKKVPTEHLETRNAQGETPVHLALKLGNLPAFEVLLAAGANQRTKDEKGRNLLHTIYGDAYCNHVSLFKKKVSMLDQNLIPDMVLEKCSGTEPGALTALALFLRQDVYNHKSEQELLDLMLQLSMCKDLTVMDGSGDYPLHVEVRSDNSTRSKYLARKRPDLLFRENATGMTPVEVAETAYFRSRVDHAPSIQIEPPLSQYYSRVKDHSIIDKPSRDFIVQDDTPSERSTEMEGDDDLPLSHPIYRDLVSIARQYPQTRQLVSVLDANEVARRLAGQQRRMNAENRRREARGLKSRWNRYYSRNPEDESDDGQGSDGTNADETSPWFEKAKIRIYRLPFMHHAEDTSEAVEAELKKWRDFAEGRIDVIKCCEQADSHDKYERRDHKKMTSEIGEVSSV